MYEQDLQGCFKKDSQKEGLSRDFIKPLKPILEQSVEALRKAYREKSLPLLLQPYLRKDIQDIKELVLRLQDDFSDVIILGTGGSSLGCQSLCALTCNSTPKLHFLDNIDPHIFSVLLYKLN